MQINSTTNPSGSTINQESSQIADRQQRKLTGSNPEAFDINDKPAIIPEHATQTENQHQELDNKASIKSLCRASENKEA